MKEKPNSKDKSALELRLRSDNSSLVRISRITRKRRFWFFLVLFSTVSLFQRYYIPSHRRTTAVQTAVETAELPPPSPKEWLHDIATLVKELYELLEEMRYIKPNAIVLPPHAPFNTTLTTLLNLDLDVIQLLELLPYVEASLSEYYVHPNTQISSATRFQPWGGESALLLSARFADLRDEQVLRDSRDPWHEHSERGHGGSKLSELNDEDFTPGEKKMVGFLKPWQLALTGVRSTGASSGSQYSALIVDVRSRQMCTVGLENVLGSKSESGIQSLDPHTRGRFAEGQTSDSSDHGSGALDLESYASRPATEVLRNYIKHFRTLDWVPGFQERDFVNTYPRDAYREMYRESGWPWNFSGDAFELARIAWDRHQRSRCESVEAFRQVRFLQSSLEVNEPLLETFKVDLATFDALDPNVKTPDYDPETKRYKRYPRKFMVEEIGRLEEKIRSLRPEIEAAVEKADAVPEELKREREEILEKYKIDINTECWWNSVEYS